MTTLLCPNRGFVYHGPCPSHGHPRRSANPRNHWPTHAPCDWPSSERTRATLAKLSNARYRRSEKC
eukprot:5975924-Alexandrium_andersonii.AAC.1